MKILEYIGFDASRHQSQYQKVVAALTRGTSAAQMLKS